MKKILSIVIVILLSSVSLISNIIAEEPTPDNIIYVDDDNTFYDYTDDVLCIYLRLFNRGIICRNDEKPNVNIISGSYSRIDDNVTLTLEVEGVIEDREISNSGVISIPALYGFNFITSKQYYHIDYSNESCILQYDFVYQSLSDFVVDGSNLSVTFSLNNSSETFNSVEITAIDGYIDKFEFASFHDSATNIEYSMDIEITKPDNSLYVFNKTILPLSIPVVIGKIDIEFEDLLNETLIYYSELYIDGKLIATPNIKDFQLTWNKLSFGKHTLKVIAFDYYGNRASDEMIVWKFF